MHGVDLDPELVAAFNARAAAAGLPAEATAGDARDFSLDEEFALVMAPMQLIQVLAGPAERLACLRCAARHLSPGGRLAVAIVDGFPDELTDEGPPPLPDTREVDGWVYSSLPLDAALDSGSIVVRRLRQTVSPTGGLTRRARRDPPAPAAGRRRSRPRRARRGSSRPAAARSRRPTTHVGSAVLLLEAR